LAEDLDLDALSSFASECDAITFVNLQVPLSTIKSMELRSHKVYPSSQTYEQCVSFSQELKVKADISVLVARSAHGQATTWVPTRLHQISADCIMTISPATNLDPAISLAAQQRALHLAQEISLIGVAAVVLNEQLEISHLRIGADVTGLWTLDGACTDQFEQHLRAILDLPLGDPSTTDAFTVMSTYRFGEKRDMYRPYLHLMARSPKMKFHQYRSTQDIASQDIASQDIASQDIASHDIAGHLCISGSDVAELIEECEHARDYMSAVIDE
jgi:5-(carboxyamino)imidazole ribonucleotide synthase